MSEQPSVKHRSQELYNTAWTLRLPAPQKYILLSMAAAADENGIYRRGTTYLVLDTEYSESQVKRLIDTLVEDGLITQVEASRGRRPAAFAFHLENREVKLTLQNKYSAKIGMQNEPATSALPPQNGRVQNAHQETIGIQNEPATHSHSAHFEPATNGATGRARKDSQTANTQLSDSVRLLIESWINAHPADRKPQYTYTPEIIALAKSLTAEGVTGVEVSEMTREKLTVRSGKYEFTWLAKDVRLRRESRQKSGSLTTRSVNYEPPPQTAPQVAAGIEPVIADHWFDALEQYKLQDADNYRVCLERSTLTAYNADTFTVEIPPGKERQAAGINRHLSNVLRMAHNAPVEINFVVSQTVGEAQLANE